MKLRSLKYSHAFQLPCTDLLLYVSDALRRGAGDLCVEECLERITNKR